MSYNCMSYDKCLGKSEFELSLNYFSPTSTLVFDLSHSHSKCTFLAFLLVSLGSCPPWSSMAPHWSSFLVLLPGPGSSWLLLGPPSPWPSLAPLSLAFLLSLSSLLRQVIVMSFTISYPIMSLCSPVLILHVYYTPTPIIF
jgi:hypothetical protein